MQMRSLHGSGAEMLQISRQGLVSILAGFHRPQCQLDLTIHSEQQSPVTKQVTEVLRHSVLDCSISGRLAKREHALGGKQCTVTVNAT